MQNITQAPNYYGSTIGQRLVSSPDFKKFCESKGSRHATFTFEDVGKLSRATGLTAGLTSIDKVPGVIEKGVQLPMVGDLFHESPTQNATVRWIRENSFTNAAAAVAEEGQKPEATWDLTEVDSPVRKIAVIGRITEELLDDVAGARDYFNSRLAYQIQAKEDSELLNGDGTGARITGVLNTPGIQTQPQGGDTVPDAILKGITKIRSGAFVEPSAIVMHPVDFQNLVLMKDRNGQYYSGGLFQNSYGQQFTPRQTIWQLPTVLTTFIAQGTCLVGAFTLGATIYRRQGLTIETSNSDASDFQFNRIAIRAEERLTLAVYRPLAFAQIVGLN
jgi:HK97 family phage major capsid protein